ncbi:MAG: bifunctional 2-C-methyl-D-erythritol 4-phosphate cytidylyltransferase/2-C-methyl-D-erythritol 2,4-cyclodiphosphate synthase [Beijerinckiaceae bacterium]
MTVAALFVAAGRGRRAGGGDVPKAYRLLGGEPVLTRAMRPFAEHPGVTALGVVIHADDRDLCDAALSQLGTTKPVLVTTGADTRQGSVLRGLEELVFTGCELVLVHDAARPFADPALIDRAMIAALDYGAAVPALPVTDTLVQITGDSVMAAPDRATLRAVQTPQSFRFDALLAAHRKAALRGQNDFTDDGAVMRAAGADVRVFDGDARNIKLTWPQDFDDAERRLMEERPMIVRVSNGYDVHAFGPGDHVWLGGVRIAHDQALVGHSDADVVLHAITDAALGVIGDGDIGTHFPPSDEQWRGASSDRFLAFAAQRLRERGALIDHIDVNIVCERPKIAPARETMRARIAAIAGVSVDQVAIKATTSEGLGFTGRREGIAALATVTARVPQSP